MQALECSHRVLKTGDIVLFSGLGRRSSLIKRFTGSKWSHVGMVIRLEAWDFPLLFESTSWSGVPDVECGEVISGVQIVPLHKRIKGYAGDVAIRALKEEPTPEMRQSLSSLREEIRGRPYEVCQHELLRSAYDGPFGTNRPNPESFFCSELVALAYQRMGYIDDSHPANEFTPKDFSDSGGLEIMRGELSDEFLVKKSLASRFVSYP